MHGIPGIHIVNCYNTGTGIDEGNIIGDNCANGIVASCSDGNTVIENCYNVGIVPESCTPICGSSSAVDKFSNCYYNNEIYTGSSESCGTGLTTSQMKSSSFLTMLGDAYKADTNNINNGYPILSWE